jgi:hypothetical protein
MGDLGATCDRTQDASARSVRCGREHRVSIVILDDAPRILGDADDPSPASHCSQRYCPEDDPLAAVPVPRRVVAPLHYPPTVLTRISWERFCAPDPDGQTVFVDGKNLWIRTIRRRHRVASLVIVDRDRMTAANVAFVRQVLNLAPDIDVRDDLSLRRALEASPDGERTKLARLACARR